MIAPQDLEPLPERQKFVAVAMAVCLLLAVLEMVRRRKLREEYSVLWVVTALALLVLAFEQDLILIVTSWIGAATVTSTLFFGALVFLMLVSLQFSVRLSKLTHRNKALGQKIALLEQEIENLRQEIPEQKDAGEELGDPAAAASQLTDRRRKQRKGGAA